MRLIKRRRRSQLTRLDFTSHEARAALGRMIIRTNATRPRITIADIARANGQDPWLEMVRMAEPRLAKLGE